MIAVPEAVAYDLTLDDLVRHQQQAPFAKKNRAIGWAFLLTALAAGAVDAYIEGWNSDPGHSRFWTQTAVQSGLLIGCFILAPWVYPRRMAKLHAGKPGALGPQTASVSEAGLRVTAEDGERRLPWTEIARVDQTPDLLVLQPRTTFAYVIPRRAFSSPEAADAFYQSAHGWHAAAKTKTKA